MWDCHCRFEVVTWHRGVVGLGGKGFGGLWAGHWPLLCRSQARQNVVQTNVARSIPPSGDGR